MNIFRIEATIRGGEGEGTIKAVIVAETHRQATEAAHQLCDAACDNEKELTGHGELISLAIKTGESVDRIVHEDTSEE
jgi:hypothetical protein